MNTKIVKNAKHLLTIVAGTVLFFSAVNLYMANIVTINDDMPKTIQSGSTVPVTITIEKGNVNGFGRFTCTLPKGFVASSSDQNFKFEDNTITILWVVLPTSKTFSFTFNVTAPENASESFVFSAKFSYVDDNEKQFTEIAPREVAVIGSSSPMIAGATNEPILEKIKYGDITCYRTVDFLNHNAIISITTHRSNVQSMCKIEEMLPPGYTFEALETAGSSVSSVQNVARFMWVEVPQSEKFTIIYKVSALSGYNIKDLYLNGAFTVYDTNDNQNKSFVILDRDPRISECNGNISNKPENQELSLTRDNGGYYSKTNGLSNIKNQEFSESQADFFANTDALNSLYQPSAKEISQFERTLDIPAPTVDLADDSEQDYVDEDETEDVQYNVTGTTESPLTKEVAASENNPSFSEKSTTPYITRVNTEPSNVATDNITKTQVFSATNVAPNTTNNKATTTIVAPSTTAKTTSTVAPSKTITTVASTTPNTISTLDAKSYASIPTMSSVVPTKTTMVAPANKNITLSNKNGEEQSSMNLSTNKAVEYKVQVGATHSAITNTQYFYSKRNINEKVTIERIDDWYKYTIKDFDTYLNARNQRNEIWESTPVKGAFVVAYNGKKRITVQEALMLTNQKWVK